ncbi:MAG: hypothetical protein HQL45_17675 [Alphaproteobacteria bacterium]|nr:hypothetical protein [Alphaproteobacteria bacterium]
MIDYGMVRPQYPDRDPYFQGCRLDIYGTWIPFGRVTRGWLGHMVVTGDSFIFENIGEVPYQLIESAYGPEIKEGGAHPRNERHLFKLAKPLQTGAIAHERALGYFVVLAHPPWRMRDPKVTWIDEFRCSPEFALCPTLEKAKLLFADHGKFDVNKADCTSFRYTPYR